MENHEKRKNWDLREIKRVLVENELHGKEEDYDFQRDREKPSRGMILRRF